MQIRKWQLVLAVILMLGTFVFAMWRGLLKRDKKTIIQISIVLVVGLLFMYLYLAQINHDNIETCSKLVGVQCYEYDIWDTICYCDNNITEKINNTKIKQMNEKLKEDYLKVIENERKNKTHIKIPEIYSSDRNILLIQEGLQYK